MHRIARRTTNAQTFATARACRQPTLREKKNASISKRLLVVKFSKDEVNEKRQKLKPIANENDNKFIYFYFP